MDQNKVEMFIASMSGRFPPAKLMMMREQLARLDDGKLPIIQSVEYKDPTTLLIVSILIGSLGIDRFMLGETGLGIAKLLTCGGLGIWTIVDWFLIQDMTREFNFRRFAQLAV
ncbi:MAG: TM2 domain-containing protein [Bacteroidetes bacterium]|nr:TM2 domain-containing protein [Bacteroidota bacterium]